jgi:hypothetical protein
MKKTAVVLAAVLMVYVLWSLCVTDIWSEPQARKRAMQYFKEYCTEMKVDATHYQGPLSTTVGNAEYSYEWRSNSDQPRLIGIWLRKDGDFKFYSGTGIN